MAEAVALPLKTISDLVLEKGKCLFCVGSKVKALQTQLQEMKCLLKDADTTQHKSESVRNWIAMIRDLAFQAEDVITTYAIQSSSNGRLLAYTRVLTQSYSRYQLTSEISKITSELERITKGMRDYGLRSIMTDGDEAETSTARDQQDWGRITFPNFQMGDCFVGMENELQELVSRIAEDKQHRVVSVWGMGGIGKTTIARKVYNQMIESKNHFFDCFAWVCITQQCHIQSVLKDVLVKLNVENVSSLTYSQLIEQLCEVQRAKRCLIVLDDLWETSHWDGLKHAFLVQDLKSKILITTRKQDVAEIGFSLELGILNVDDAWELLKKKAFPLNNIPGLLLIFLCA